MHSQIVEKLIKVYNFDNYELDISTKNCFRTATQSDKHETIKYFHSIYENFCKRKDKDGNTALTLAARFGLKKIVDFLIEDFNADIRKLGFDGRNCFLHAAVAGNHETMKYLHTIDENLFKEKDKNENTALTLASYFGTKETVKLLIKEFNADIYERGSKGRNCFLQAVLGGKHDTMRYLYKNDENLCKGKDGDGDTSSRK